LQNTIPPSWKAVLEAQRVDFDQGIQKAIEDVRFEATDHPRRRRSGGRQLRHGLQEPERHTGQLRAETRALVRSTAERLGFRPNSLAQSLLRRRSFTVGMISTDRYGRFSIPVLEGIEDALGSASISVFLCSAADDPERERQHVESLLAKRVDGIIVTARRADPRPPLHFAHPGPPVLYAFARVNDPRAQCLLPDDFGGGKLAGDHLVGAAGASRTLPDRKILRRSRIGATGCGMPSRRRAFPGARTG
jgi:hypothetical protein